MSGAKKIIQELSILCKERGVPRSSLRTLLNKKLPKESRIKITQSGLQQLHRWMNVNAKSWVCPRADIVLAMNQVLGELQ